MPRWIGSYFDDEPVEFSRTVQWTDGRSVSSPWTAHPFSLTVRAVCAGCNNGWMSALEQRVQPVLEPLVHLRPAELDAVTQHTLALWAFKTMLMIRLASDENESPEIDVDEYSYLLKHQALPPGEQVWLAAYEGEGQWPATSHYWAVSLAPPGTDPPDEPNAHCCSFAVGHAAFSLMGHRLIQSPLAIQATDPRAWSPIWPTLGATIDFPPPLILAGDPEMQRFGMPAEWRSA